MGLFSLFLWGISAPTTVADLWYVHYENAERALASESWREAVEEIQQALEREGVGMSSVPKLKCGMDELTKLEISPQEGFMLTRVDGSFDIKSILKMSPMPALDAQMLFWRLKASGHVVL